MGQRARRLRVIRPLFFGRIDYFSIRRVRQCAVMAKQPKTAAGHDRTREYARSNRPPCVRCSAPGDYVVYIIIITARAAVADTIPWRSIIRACICTLYKYLYLLTLIFYIYICMLCTVSICDTLLPPTILLYTPCVASANDYYFARRARDVDDRNLYRSRARAPIRVSLARDIIARRVCRNGQPYLLVVEVIDTLKIDRLFWWGFENISGVRAPPEHRLHGSTSKLSKLESEFIQLELFGGISLAVAVNESRVDFGGIPSGYLAKPLTDKTIQSRRYEQYIVIIVKRDLVGCLGGICVVREFVFFFFTFYYSFRTRSRRANSLHGCVSTAFAFRHFRNRASTLSVFVFADNSCKTRVYLSIRAERPSRAGNRRREDARHEFVFCSFFFSPIYDNEVFHNPYAYDV